MKKAALLALLFSASALAHPLDPLDEKEITRASKLVGAYQEFPKGALYPMIALNEPPKAEVLAWEPGKPHRREALAIVLDRAANRTYEAIIDLNANKVSSWKLAPGIQPLVLVEEYETVPKIVKADPRWQEAMRNRGITDFEKVQVDTWAAGPYSPKGHESSRLLRAITYYKGDKGTDINFYGRPVEGVIAIVDISQGKIVEMIESDPVPLAERVGEFNEKANAPLRKVKPVVTSQPKGRNWTKTGHEVRWQNWRFRYGMHPREGLVLYQVGYEDGGKVRPIVYRLSLSEMAVPYGAPQKAWAWRSAFDEGEYGVGRLASPLEPKVDAPENAAFFDAVFVDDFGRPYLWKNTVAMYERDGGVLWKHYDIYTKNNDVRRSKELVIFFVAAIGNYDYALAYVFRQDGTLAVECQLTGIMLPMGVAEKTVDGHHTTAAWGPYGHLVAPNVVAPHHQHFFNFRIDFDVDGTGNSALEHNTRQVEDGGDNPPWMNVFTMETTTLKSEKEAGRLMNLASSRKWSVVNPSKKTALGYNPGFYLIPGENSLPYLHPDSITRKRAGFIENHFWVTRYREGEVYAGGTYPNQGRSIGEGLPAWVKDNESLENQDLVAWYTFGVTHIPRPEEWPVMPTAHAGFKIIPSGFFTQNPAMDVPKY